MTGAQRVVLFVCPHGAGKSRLAAALFNAAPPAGWRATTAGVDPAEAVNPNAQRLASGTPAEAHFDVEAPRHVSAAGTADRVVAIDCDVAGAERWDLYNTQIAEPLREELHERVATFARSLEDER